MKKLALAGCALALTGATPLLAQEQAFVWGGEFEIGVDSTVTSDDPAGELTDNYASLSLAFEAGVATSITLFGEPWKASQIRPKPVSSTIWVFM